MEPRLLTVLREHGVRAVRGYSSDNRDYNGVKYDFFKRGYGNSKERSSFARQFIGAGAYSIVCRIRGSRDVMKASCSKDDPFRDWAYEADYYCCGSSFRAQCAPRVHGSYLDPDTGIMLFRMERLIPVHKLPREQSRRFWERIERHSREWEELKDEISDAANERGYNFDLHSDNYMARVQGWHVQPVITDPWSHRDSNCSACYDDTGYVFCEHCGTRWADDDACVNTDGDTMCPACYEADQAEKAEAKVVVRLPAVRLTPVPQDTPAEHA